MEFKMVNMQSKTNIKASGIQTKLYNKNNNIT